jgi:hypothetical protein
MEGLVMTWHCIMPVHANVGYSDRLSVVLKTDRHRHMCLLPQRRFYSNHPAVFYWNILSNPEVRLIIKKHENIGGLVS